MPVGIMAIVVGIGIYAAYRMVTNKPRTEEREPEVILKETK